MLHEITVSKICCLTSLTKKLYGIRDTLSNNLLEMRRWLKYTFGVLEL